MIRLNYKTKKELKESIGKRLHYTETSMSGDEYVSTGVITGCNFKRSWYANVRMENDLIVKVD